MQKTSTLTKEQALKNAVSSVEIEGYHISEYEKKLCSDVLNGVLSKNDFIKIMLERCSS